MKSVADRRPSTNHRLDLFVRIYLQDDHSPTKKGLIPHQFKEELPLLLGSDRNPPAIELSQLNSSLQAVFRSD